VNGRYEEGDEFGWFMAEVCAPDCRRQLLQTAKECFRQILKVGILAFETHGLGTRPTCLAWNEICWLQIQEMSLTLEPPERMSVQLLKPSD